MNPSVSVLIPVYNAGLYLAACLDSVLAQTVLPSEIIAVNDGSTDDSLCILRDYARRSEVPFRVISRENRGASVTLNEAIAAATGDVIALQDADDLWLPDKLARQLACLAANPALEACFAHTECFISPDLPAEIRAGIACPSGPQPGMHKQTMMIRHAALARVGGFDPQFQMGDFLEWFLRAQSAGLRYHLLAQVVTRRRLHRSGLASQIENRVDYARVLKAALDRKRHQS